MLLFVLESFLRFAFAFLDLPLATPVAFLTGLFESDRFVAGIPSSESEFDPLPIKCLDLRVLDERVSFRTGFLTFSVSDRSESRLLDLVGVLLFTAFLVAGFLAGGLESSEESPLSESLESSSLDEEESSESELLEELL